jgi:hypothetical protein
MFVAFKPFAQKYFSSVFQKTMISSPHPASPEGRSANRHRRGARDAMDARAAPDE